MYASFHTRDCITLFPRSPLTFFCSVIDFIFLGLWARLGFDLINLPTQAIHENVNEVAPVPEHMICHYYIDNDMKLSPDRG